MGDGASGLRILVSIIVPVALPILMAVAMLSFIYSWNEFLFGLILTTRDAVPVTVGATFFVTSYGVKWGQTAAAMVLGVLPPPDPRHFRLSVYRKVDAERRGERVGACPT